MSESRDASSNEDLRALIDAALNGTASPEESAQLARQLAEDESARAFYVSYVDLHAELAWQLRSGLPESDILPMCPPARPAPPVRARGARFWMLGVAAAILVAVFTGLQLAPRPQLPSLVAVTSAVATLTRIEGILRFDASESQLSVGAPLTARRLFLDQGLAEITFGDGAVLVLEGPAQLELKSASRGFLHAGRAVTQVPPKAVGFVLETARANVLDLGTEFGVSVDGAGDTMVQVFDGVVVTDFKDGKAQGEGRRLTAGQAVGIAAPAGSSPRDLPFARERFIRRFPIAKERGKDWYRPYNRSQYDTVHVVPAPRGLKIDGDLSDWDHSGRFESACDQPFAEHYFVAGTMMYDDQNLYIGAHVGDPSPMESSFDPHVEPRQTWSGGSLQVRLYTAAAQTWPLSFEHADGRKRVYTPADLNENLVHLTITYYQPRQEACLHVDYGMDYHGTLVNPPGYRGAYRKDANGQGYTLEYAIPWKLLSRGDNPPKSGDMLATTWDLHWSEQEGRSWRGHLVEISNPDVEGWTFIRSATWGKAKLHATGNLPPGTVERVPARW